jgi:hypothetical protein
VPYRIRFVGSTEVRWILSSNSTRLWGLQCGTSHICGENAGGQLAGQHLLGSVCQRPRWDLAGSQIDVERFFASSAELTRGPPAHKHHVPMSYSEALVYLAKQNQLRNVNHPDPGMRPLPQAWAWVWLLALNHKLASSEEPQSHRKKDLLWVTGPSLPACNICNIKVRATARGGSDARALMGSF